MRLLTYSPEHFDVTYEINEWMRIANGPNPENSGSHRVYGRPGIPEIIDWQPRGHEAKPYQVR